MKEPARCDARHGLFERVRRVRGSVDDVVPASNDPVTRDGHQRDLLALARFESHGCSRGYVEPPAETRRAIEREQPVRLDEVEVRTHLDGPVPGVGHLEQDARTVLVQGDVAEVRVGVNDNVTRRADAVGTIGDVVPLLPHDVPE